MKILGIDASLTATGICLLNETKYVTELITTKLKGMERLIFIRDKIRDIIGATKPELVVLEGYSMGSRKGQAFSIGELGGVVKVMLHEISIRTLIVAPTTLKLFVMGKGNAKKNLMIMKTFKKYGEEFESDDLCDAYCLAKLGDAYLNGTSISYENKALKKVSNL